MYSGNYMRLIPVMIESFLFHMLYLYFFHIYVQAKLSSNSDSYRGWDNKPHNTARGAYNDQLLNISVKKKKKFQ